MAGGIPGPTTVRSFGFNIPCRRFLIRANVTRDRRLPVVDEFVLRDAEALRGRARAPARDVFRIHRRGDRDGDVGPDECGPYSRRGDIARLHPSAQEHFRGWEDGVPRVVELESWVVRLWFDLVNKNMAVPDRTRSARHLIDIRPSEPGEGPAGVLRTEGVRREFCGVSAKGAADGESRSLRTLLRLGIDRRAFWLLGVSYGGRSHFDPEPHLRPRLIAIEAEDLTRFRPLATAMLDAYRGLNWIEASGAALAEFSGLSGETTVADAYDGSARFDLPRWFSLNPDRKNPDRQNLVGASYIRRNVDFLTNLIDNLPKPGSSIEAAKEREIVWYRPGGSGWGCSPELQEAILSIKYAMRRRFGKIPIRTKLICPAVSRRDHPDRFKNLFDEGHIAPPGFLSPAIEVVHIPQVATLMLVTVALSENVQVPVGFASVATAPLSRAARQLAQVEARFEELWRSERREEEPLPIETDIEDDGDA